MSEEESKHEDMMAKMKAAGLSGQMYNRDDIMSQVSGQSLPSLVPSLPYLRDSFLGAVGRAMLVCMLAVFASIWSLI